MTEIEFVVPPRCDLSQASRLIEGAIAACELRIAMTGTLRSYPGCIHWHLKRGRESGTLELTLWEAKRRVWASVQDGRRGAWIKDALLRVKLAVETAFLNAVS